MKIEDAFNSVPPPLTINIQNAPPEVAALFRFLLELTCDSEKAEDAKRFFSAQSTIVWRVGQNRPELVHFLPPSNN